MLVLGLLSSGEEKKNFMHCKFIHSWPELCKEPVVRETNTPKSFLAEISIHGSIPLQLNCTHHINTLILFTSGAYEQRSSSCLHQQECIRTGACNLKFKISRLFFLCTLTSIVAHPRGMVV